MANKTEVIDIDYPSLHALIARVEHAIDNELALTSDDMRLLLGAINTLLEVQTKLDEKNITLNKLRKLLGMVKSSEKRNTPQDQSTDTHNKQSRSNNKTKKPRKPKKPFEPKKVVHHKLATATKGDRCPQCGTGTLRKYDPKVVLRMSGSSPFTAEKHVVERLKCDLCDAVITADLPRELVQDGGVDHHYGYSARSVMAIFKHFSGVPYYHQETLNDLFGCPITASTIFDQCEYLANDCMPLFHQMMREAANAKLFYIDDTSNRILNQKGEVRPTRNGKGTRLRTGIYTSGLIAVMASGHRLFLYNTNLGHAGEFIDHILEKRDPDLSEPIIMSDALSSNTPTVATAFKTAYCNAHGRRQFLDVENNFPEEVDYIVSLYGNIWQHDGEASAQEYTDQQRLDHHKTHSLPVMNTIKTWCVDQVNAPDAEQHSGLLKACRYFINHYDGLTLFCSEPGAPIDNNVMEEGLKVKIRTRKTSHFYKTQVGADVANVLTSVIATAYRNDCNAFEYLNRIQANRKEVKLNAQKWLPWNQIDDTS